MRIGINWACGGVPNLKDFGSPRYLLVAAGVLAVILLLLRFAKGFIQNISVPLGIVVGYAITVALDWPNFTGLDQ
jgi:xanthine/uracil permease